ncbi:hypothetical protein EDB89DRAFT_137245 [Lactarius sanguifluus]|nr:hypothetical protein EDB89DRAFT_137245 [Lactarius sanguifluus]
MYASSSLQYVTRSGEMWSRRCRGHFRCSHVLSLPLGIHWVWMCQSFPVDSWVDLSRVYNNSFYTASPFQNYQHFFCRPVTLVLSISTIYPRPVTFHRRRWLQDFPYWPSSRPFGLCSLPRFICPNKGEDVRIPQCGPSFPLSEFTFRGHSEYLEAVLCQSGTKSGLGGRQVGLVGSATEHD